MNNVKLLEEFGFPCNYSNSSKHDVFDFLLNFNTDKSGYLVKEVNFKKYFPSLYSEYIIQYFPQESISWEFRRKLWHFLQNDCDLLLGKCIECGSRCVFKTFKTGYTVYCSSMCQKKSIVKNNKVRLKWKEKTYDEIKGHILKNKQSKLVNHGSENYNNIDKSKNTKFERYGDCNYNNREKSSYTCISKYGKRNCVESDEFKKSKDVWLKKAYDTKSINNTWNKTSLEEKFEQYLIDNNYNYKLQYSSDDRYPYNCDFYLVDYDTFVEIQGYWTHGKHPFDAHNENDIALLNKWKSLSNGNNMYDAAIYNWTISDVNKRNKAIEEKLNFIELFGNNMDDIIKEFNKNIKSN